MLALRPALEAANTVRDAMLDPLVVTGLEVQPGVIFARPPIASIQCLRTQNIQRRRDASARATCEYEQNLPGHGAGNGAEELQIQIRRRPVLPIGPAVAVMKESQVRVAGIAAFDALESDPGVSQPAALLPDLLAFVMVHT